MLPVAQAVSFATSMGAQLAAKMQALGGADVADADYSDVRSALEQLRTNADTAVSRDEDEANSLWTELGAVVRHGFDYFQARREFNAGALAAKAGLEAAIRAAEAVVRVRVAPHADVPAQLAAAARHWAMHRVTATKAAAAIPPLKLVEGWSGPSANQYGSAAELQGAAAASYSTYVEAVESGYRSGRQLNQAVFFTLAQDLSNAAKTVASNNGSLASNGSEYYRRTCAAARVISMSLQAVVADLGGRVAGDAANALSQQLDQARSSSTVLSPGSWPTGTQGGAAGPDNMNTVSNPQNVDTSSATTGPTDTTGVNY